MLLFQSPYRIPISRRHEAAGAAGPSWDLDSQGSVAFRREHGSVCASVSLCSSAHPSATCTKLPLVLPLLAFFLSPSFCRLSSRATNANMLYKVRSGPRHSLPEGEVTQKKTWKDVLSNFSSTLWMKTFRGLTCHMFVFACLKFKWKKVNAPLLTYVQNCSPFMSKEAEKN